MSTTTNPCTLPHSASTTANPSNPPATVVLRPPSLVEPPQSLVLLCPPSVPLHFDWAEDAKSLPMTTSSAEAYGPRDLSDLRSSQPAPFQNLQRRVRWHRSTRRRAPPQCFSSQKSFHVALPSHTASPLFITRRHPASIGPGRPVVTIPVGVAPAPAAPALKLDWDQDPHLVNLSQALCALGWTPP
jgi:hypothetical protein